MIRNPTANEPGQVKLGKAFSKKGAPEGPFWEIQAGLGQLTGPDGHLVEPANSLLGRRVRAEHTGCAGGPGSSQRVHDEHRSGRGVDRHRNLLRHELELS